MSNLLEKLQSNVSRNASIIFYDLDCITNLKPNFLNLF